ncbi:hypothetical protein [Segetibacter aerophilus]|uniref:Lipoprotein n=1 Tax=Segetibacter aerophilus TaxID=670293 RepID=A0A512BG89_9BACT|nr:hypothetical protein [Segetibacter aerophilus]GEO10978.1 hypothetical protein SAE01_34740 [Segetibacter aerophilus]
MKKLQTILSILACFIAVSCNYNSDNLSITYSNSEQFYTMKASFDRNKTRDVEEYMDRKIGASSKMSFVDHDIDGTVALNDRSKFHIQKSPGVLEIQLDKAENSAEAYRMVKSMCEGIKPILTRK